VNIKPKGKMRVVQVSTQLYKVYITSGVFGIKENDKPEVQYTRGIPRHSLPHVLMNVAALDYNTSATPLWVGAERAFECPATRFIFTPRLVVQKGPVALGKAMLATGFYGRYPKQNVQNLYRIATTLVKYYNGNVINLLQMHDFDAIALWENRKKLGDLPSLTGPKVFPFFLRMLKDVAKIKFKRYTELPMPVDVHILRATYRLILNSNKKPSQKDAKAIRELWSKGLQGTQLYPLLLDRALWSLSRYGCSGTDGKDECVKIDFCPVRGFCVFSTNNKKGAV